MTNQTKGKARAKKRSKKSYQGLEEEIWDTLLRDRTTGGYILWGTEEYSDRGADFAGDAEITPKTIDKCAENPDYEIVPRILKSKEIKTIRTLQYHESFKPAWQCNDKINILDEGWFGRKDTFNSHGSHHTWHAKRAKVAFPPGKTWQDYVGRTCLETCCGEASHLVSRYDAVYGNGIRKAARIGLLDRKMRVICENARTTEEWLDAALRAYESTYGYEYLGDSLFLARTNLLWAFEDYYNKRWHKSISKEWCHRIAEVISWNIWQMDGWNDTVPFSLIEDGPSALCQIRLWQSGQTVCFSHLDEKQVFDVIVGRSPKRLECYMEEYS